MVDTRQYQIYDQHDENGFTGPEELIMPKHAPGWRRSASQNNVPDGYTRYEFDTAIDGRRERKRVVCQPEMVREVYREWVAELTGSQKLYTLLDEFLVHYRVTHKNRQQIQNVERSVARFKEFFENGNVDTIRRKDLEAYIHWRLQEVTEATTNRDLAVLSSFFTWLIVNEQYPRANPAHKLKLKENNTREINLTAEQLQELHRALDAHPDTTFRLACILAIYTGMRQAEIRSITWDDVDLEARYIRLKGMLTKSGKRRDVAIPTFLADLLKEIPRQEDRLIPLTKNALSSRWKRFSDRLPFETPYGRLRFHDLRHVNAQLLKQAGISLDDLADHLGHHSPAFTKERYAQTACTDMHIKVDRLGAVYNTTRHIIQ